uniref:Uncharacterized protein n=1 Tax=Pyxicephalus adspersus TaxID=30357 RepID=A0AAV2ZT52_PYXAD|nr:TPA: hypothetical protein GDO54_018197 [Pyxicephalus adspersus]
MCTHKCLPHYRESLTLIKKKSASNIVGSWNWLSGCWPYAWLRQFISKDRGHLCPSPSVLEIVFGLPHHLVLLRSLTVSGDYT